jgi:hypothetical protein
MILVRSDHSYNLESGYTQGGPIGQYCRVRSCSTKFLKSLSYVRTCHLAMAEAIVAFTLSFMT